MTVDGITLYAAVKELDNLIKGARIDKIFMPVKDEIDLVLRAGNVNRRLKISIHPVDFRLHLTDHADKNPDSPPVFCMFLRKHLTNAQIEAVYTHGLERVVFFDITARDEMGVKRPIKLIAELMGKNSNVVLAGENGKIMECVKHIGIDVSRVRQMLPSLPYQMPPGEKQDPLALSEEKLAELIRTRGQKSLSNHLTANLAGFSPQTAGEMLAGGWSDAADAATRIKTYLSAVETGAFAPRIAADRETGKEYFSCVSTGGSKAQFSSVNAMLDFYYHQKREAETLINRRAAFAKVLQKHMEKKQKRLQNQLETLEEAKQADTCKKYGDLITANLYRLKKNADFAELEDYYGNGDTIRIPLEKRVSPAANAQKYYKRYNKLKSAAEITRQQKEENERELAFLKSVEISLENSENNRELDEIQYELVKTGYMSVKKGQMPKPNEQVSTPHAFLSSDGFEIYAGKNNRQNDLLTLKYAGLNDTWMHIKDFPGAHVIIKSGGKPVPPRTLEEAASIAAVLSRGKQADKIAIDYTPRKNVKKPSGAKPGMVIYENYRTIYIRPDMDVFNRLKARAEANSGERP